MLINDHFQNFKSYNIPRAQLVIADIPYNIGVNAYGSNPQWYVDGDNANGKGIDDAAHITPPISTRCGRRCAMRTSCWR